jgi:hypothetical protein
VRVELTGGQWAEMHDSLAHITNDQRDELECIYDETGMVFGPNGWVVERGGEMRKLKAVNRFAIRLAVTAWSLDLPLPSEDPSVLGRISAHDGKILEDAVVGLSYTAEPVNTSLDAAIDGEGKVKPDAPFSSSGRSKARLKAAN